MKKQIKKLEQKARKLEPSVEECKKLSRQTLDYTNEFLTSLDEQKAFSLFSNEEGGLEHITFSEEPRELDELLDYLCTQVDSRGLNPASGGHLGYIPGGGLYPSALGDFIAAITNRYAGVFFSSPGAVHIENQCIRWLCDLIGYGPKAGGNLTSGGSLANLIGLVNARDDLGLTAAEFDKAVIYTTRQVHHCVIKAIKFAGLTDAHVRLIDMDDQFRMQPPALKKALQRDLEKGLQPLAVFASAGTTDVGAVDPLDDIAGIAQQFNVWLHIDAAYGGAFLLTEYGKEKMKGIHHADSVTIDPHKGFFLPYGSGALLVKDEEKLFESQHMSANYLQDTKKVTVEPSPADLSPELSKHFRGLRMWLPLQLFGIAPFRAALEEKLLLTRYFYEKVQSIPGMEVGPEPELSVLYFRYVPQKGDANDFNQRLMNELHADGRVFLSSTNIEGIFYIRLAVLHFRTHLETIDQTLQILKNKISKLQ